MDLACKNIPNQEASQAPMRCELREWEEVYNTVRPHQALGYLTAKEFVDRWRHKQTSSQGL